MKIKFFLIFILSLLMSACVIHRPLTMNTPQFKSCIASCQTRLATCGKLCKNNCPRCKANSRCHTKKHYCKYVHEERVKGGFVARELNSYRDPLKCRKVSCNCQADYSACYQSCGGVIRKQLKVAPTCC